MKRPLYVIVVVLCASLWTSASARAIESNAEPHPNLLDKLVGKWVLKGELAGKQTVHDVQASWVLNDRYVRLDEVSRDIDDHGRPAYEASIFIGWEPRSQTYTCIWLDSTAVDAGGGSCVAKPTPNRIPFLFLNKAGAVIFANTFVYNPGVDHWEWKLDDVSKGKRTPFGRVILSRR
ncbi:MAG: hypothetical protein ACREEB_01060 [Caulobacteraceae bacterium]